MDNNKKIVLGCVLAGSAALAAYLVYTKLSSKTESEEELKFSTKKASSSPAPASKEDAEIAALAEQLLKDELKSLQRQDSSSQKHFPDLGLKLQLQDDWEAIIDEFSLAGPQIAVIRVVPPGADQANFGEMPSISIIVEDVSREQLTLLEYKEKSKEFASNAGAGFFGMTMAGPQIIKDEPVSIGPFRHTLEYTQVFPNPEVGYVPFQSLNLMAIHKGLVYVVQYMARTDKFADFHDGALQLAKNLVIEDLPPRKPSFIEYTSIPGHLQLTVPESWSVTRENKEESGRTLVVAFASGSANKPETISIYKLSAPGSSPDELISKFASQVGCTSSSSGSIGDGISKATLVGSDKKQTFAYAISDSLLTVKSDVGDYTSHNVSVSTLQDMLKSIKPFSDDRLPSGKSSRIRFVSTEHRFSFDVVSSSRLLEHKWGDTSVTYSPIAVTEDNAEQSVPVFSVAVNKEHEPYSDLQQVENRILADSDPNSPIREKKREKIGNREFLSFIVSREESSSPFGPREEFKSKILITLRGEESVMLKWEVAANEWLRYERYLTGILDSFQLL